MISALSGGEGLGSAASLYFTQPAQGVNGPGNGNGLSGGEGGGAIGTSSAVISGPGQLLSDLQQLQSQNPTKFTQVVSQIANQLQGAAQQTQGPQSTFLNNLAAMFQSVANGGSLSQLQPHHGGHHHHVQQAYSQGSQTQPQGVQGLLQSNGSQPSTGLNLQQLFSTIVNEVSSALS